MQEYDAWIYSDTDPKMEQAPNIDQLQQLCDEASKKHGKHFNNSEFQKQWMIDAGFTNVQEVVFKVSELCNSSVPTSYRSLTYVEDSHRQLGEGP